jgi:hypothetical protein
MGGKRTPGRLEESNCNTNLQKKKRGGGDCRYYDNILEEQQSGFRKGRSCSDGYFTMKILLEKHWEFNMETRITFAELKKAFDRLNRTKLLEILQNDNIPQ